MKRSVPHSFNADVDQICRLYDSLSCVDTAVCDTKCSGFLKVNSTGNNTNTFDLCDPREYTVSRYTDNGTLILIIDIYLRK